MWLRAILGFHSKGQSPMFGLCSCRECSLMTGAGTCVKSILIPWDIVRDTLKLLVKILGQILLMKMTSYDFSSLTVPPKIMTKNDNSQLVVREGENLTLSCNATGHPTPHIVWRREDGEDIMLSGRKGIINTILRLYSSISYYFDVNMILKSTKTSSSWSN